jgi:hypothetical protein
MLLKPDPEFASLSPADLCGRLQITFHQAIQAYVESFLGRNQGFDRIIQRHKVLGEVCNDQCSPEYYFDLYTAFSELLQAPPVQQVSSPGRRARLLAALRASAPQIPPLTQPQPVFSPPKRIVEVGVFMGGASVVLAGLASEHNLKLDLVDINDSYLRFARERARRAFPEVKIRCFQGGLAEYVAQVLLPEGGGDLLVQHDASHAFEQVVKDLAALSFVRERVHALAIQDTNLRGRPPHLNFVDAAVHAVLGNTVPYRDMGILPTDERMLRPNAFEGNYFLADRAEGMLLLLRELGFRYPHPDLKLEEFLSSPPTRQA